MIERFCDRIEGFNKRSLTLGDLVAVCARLGIEVVYKPLRRLHGAADEDRGFQYIYVNSLLSEVEKIIAGFHEFCHLTDHVLETEIFKSTGNLWNLNKFDRQAQIVGVVALMPAALIEGMIVEEIMREFGVRREIAEFRASLTI